MQATLQASVIANFVQDKPSALADLGKGFLKFCYPKMNAQEVPDLHCQQVGYIVSQVMLGANFPAINLTDTSTTTTFRITKINTAWVKAVLFQHHPANSAEIVQIAAAILARPPATAKGTFTVKDNEEHARHQNLAQIGAFNPNCEECVNNSVRKLAEEFRDGTLKISPANYVNDPVGWLVIQLMFFSKMPSIRNTYQKTVTELLKTLQQHSCPGPQAADCVLKLHQVYHAMAGDLARRFNN